MCKCSRTFHEQKTTESQICYVETVYREGELADLEKIMDSFDAEEKIIGTIVKVDGDRLQGLSDSPPRITLSAEAVTRAIEVNNKQPS